jgi:hypothetical protein
VLPVVDHAAGSLLICRAGFSYELELSRVSLREIGGPIAVADDHLVACGATDGDGDSIELDGSLNARATHRRQE